MNQKLNKNELKWLSEQLRFGDKKRIHRTYGVTPYAINRFLRGEIDDPDVLNAILKLLDQRSGVYKRFRSLMAD